MWRYIAGRQLTIFNSQSTIKVGGLDRDRPFQGQLSGMYYNGLKVFSMAAEGDSNIKVQGSVRLVGDSPASNTPQSSAAGNRSDSHPSLTGMSTTTATNRRNQPAPRDPQQVRFAFLMVLMPLTFSWPSETPSRSGWLSSLPHPVLCGYHYNISVCKCRLFICGYGQLLNKSSFILSFLDTMCSWRSLPYIPVSTLSPKTCTLVYHLKCSFVRMCDLQ